MCQFPVTVFIRLRDTRSLCSAVSVLVYLPRPHQSFVATSDFFWCQLFSLFLASTGFCLCFLVINCFVQSGNPDRNWQRRDLAGVCLVTYLHQNLGIKEVVSHMKHFKRAGPILSEHFIVSPNNIHQLSWSSHTDSSRLRRPDDHKSWALLGGSNKKDDTVGRGSTTHENQTSQTIFLCLTHSVCYCFMWWCLKQRNQKP